MITPIPPKKDTILYSYQRAVYMCRLSLHKRYMVAAVVYCPKGFIRSISTNKDIFGRHAETEACSGKSYIPENSGMAIARINRATPSVQRCGKPCRKCLTYIKSFGIRWVTYLNETNTLETLYVPTTDMSQFKAWNEA